VKPPTDPRLRAFAEALGRLLADAVWREIDPKNAKAARQDGTSQDHEHAEERQRPYHDGKRSRRSAP